MYENHQKESNGFSRAWPGNLLRWMDTLSPHHLQCHPYHADRTEKKVNINYYETGEFPLQFAFSLLGPNGKYILHTFAFVKPFPQSWWFNKCMQIILSCITPSHPKFRQLRNPRKSLSTFQSTKNLLAMIDYECLSWVCTDQHLRKIVIQTNHHINALINTWNEKPKFLFIQYNLRLLMSN